MADLLKIEIHTLLTTMADTNNEAGVHQEGDAAGHPAEDEAGHPAGDEADHPEEEADHPVEEEADHPVEEEAGHPEDAADHHPAGDAADLLQETEGVEDPREELRTATRTRETPSKPDSKTQLLRRP